MSFALPGSHCRQPTIPQGGENACTNARHRCSVLDRPVQLGHRQGDRVLPRPVRMERGAAAGGLRRLLHVHEGRQARRRLHAQRRRAGVPGRVGRPPHDGRRRGGRRGDAGARRQGRVRADGRRRERQLHDDHRSGRRARRRLAAEPAEGLRGHRRDRDPRLVRAPHPRVRADRRVLSRRLPLGHARGERHGRVPLHDARRGRGSARRDHGRLAVSRRRAGALGRLLRRERRRCGDRADRGARRPRGAACRGHAVRSPRDRRGPDRHAVPPRPERRLDGSAVPSGRAPGGTAVRRRFASSGSSRPARAWPRGPARDPRRGRRRTRCRPTGG